MQRFPALPIAAALAELMSWGAVAQRASIVLLAIGVPSLLYSKWFPIQLSAVVGLAAGASSVPIALSWFKSSRLDGLLLLPFSRRLVLLAVSVAGALSVLASTVAPLALFVGVLGALSPEKILVSVVIGAFVAGIFFACASLLYSLEGMVRSPLKGPGASTLFPRSKPLAASAKPSAPSLQMKGLGFRRMMPNYLASAMLHDSRAWFSLLAMTVVGLVVSDFELSRGVMLPVHSICGVLVPAWSTLLSRDRDTRQQLLMFKSTGSLARTYAKTLICIVMPIIVLADALLFIAGRPVGPVFLASSILAYLAAVLVIVVLETRYPVLKWKTEYDLYLRPRRYYPLLAAVLVALLFLQLP